MFNRRLFLVAGAGAPAILGAGRALADAPKPPTLEELTREPDVKSASLSPDGSKVALLSQETVDGETRSQVVIIDVRAEPKPVNTIKLGFGRGDWVRWANPERLLICFSVELTAGRKELGSRLTQTRGGTRVWTRRVMAIGADGAQPVVLFENAGKLTSRNLDLGDITDISPDDPQTVLMPAWDMDRRSLFKVDVYTGASLRIERGAPSTGGFVTQAGVPVLRFDFNGRGSVMKVLARAPGESDWTKVSETPTRDLFGPGFDVLAAAPEPGVVFVLARREADPTRAVWRYDLRTKSFAEPLNSRPDLDASGAVFDSDGAFIGARYVEDRTAYAFTDRSLQAHFKGLNAFFENACNVEVAGVSRNRRRFLLWASGPKEPGGYFLYDLDRKGVDALAQSRPWIAPERLAATETIQVKTRDGQSIRAYLTVPLAVPAKAPLVIMPHGGPEARDQIDFDPWVQALAAQGWLVVQPQFRGSSGFGKAFAEAGYRQWGGRMQDDLTDTVKALTDSGRADPKRVAIFGWSYGGYAALMGAASTPDLYAAVVAGAGPSDLPDMLAEERKQEDVDFGVFAYWTKIIGDLRADRAALERASPRRRAAEITAPVLIAHGDLDGVVPVEQSRAMLKALKAAGKTVRYVEFEGEGHDLETEAHAKFVQEAVDFLRPHLA